MDEQIVLSGIRRIWYNSENRNPQTSLKKRKYKIEKVIEREERTVNFGGDIKSLVKHSLLCPGWSPCGDERTTEERAFTLFLQEKVRKNPEKFQIVLAALHFLCSVVNRMPGKFCGQGGWASSEISKQGSKSGDLPATVPLVFFMGGWRPQERQRLDRT